MPFTTRERRDARRRTWASSATTAALITAIRAQHLGAVIGSTPALMDAPSLDPPPDDDYGVPDATGDVCRRPQGSARA